MRCALRGPINKYVNEQMLLNFVYNIYLDLYLGGDETPVAFLNESQTGFPL